VSYRINAQQLGRVCLWLYKS